MPSSSLYTLGDVHFSAGAIDLSGFTRDVQYRWTPQELVSGRAHMHFAGHGEESITLDGVVFPGQYGAGDAVEKIEALAGTGKTQTLIDGRGVVLGDFAVKSINEERMFMMSDGGAREQTYSISLMRDRDEG